MTATTDVPMVGAIVHYVLPNGRCRPALVIEHATALATAEASVRAVAQVVAAQKTLTNLERASVILDRGSGRLSSAFREQAQVAVATFTGQRDALAEVDAQRAALERAQADLETAHAAERAAVGLLDLQVYTNGDADVGQIPEQVTALHAIESVPLAVRRAAVPHDAGKTGPHAPGTWHALTEEA